MIGFPLIMIKKTDIFRVKKEDGELLRKNMHYPRERVAHRNKKNNVIFLGKNPLHPREKLGVKIKKTMLYF